MLDRGESEVTVCAAVCAADCVADLVYYAAKGNHGTRENKKACVDAEAAAREVWDAAAGEEGRWGVSEL